MEFRTIENLIVLADELNFHRAARRLHLSQPTLSRQIAALERELGADLFVRDRHGVRLTSVGRTFVIEARRALHRLERAKRAVRETAAEPHGTVRLAFVSSFASRCLPRLLKASRQRNPLLSYELHAMSSQAQIDALRRGQLDGGIIRGPLTTPGIATHLLWEEDFLLAVPEDFPDGRDSTAPPSSLESYTFVGFQPSIEPALFRLTEARALEAHLSLEPAHLVTGTSALMALISAGHAISLVPEGLTTETHNGVSYRPAAGSTRSALCLAWREDDDRPALAPFLGLALETARRDGLSHPRGQGGAFPSASAMRSVAQI